MLLRYDHKREGPIPSESVVAINTATGTQEEVIVHKSQVNDKGIEVGFIDRKEGAVLVELPRESVTGKWRLWVQESLVLQYA